MDMLLEADELITIAIMQEQPILMVEGIDDIPIYKKILTTIPIDCEVYCSEHIADIEPGCRGVKKIISIINEQHPINLAKKYLLGIVDKDVSDFRGEIEDLENLLFTIYYSMESHLVNDAVLKKIFSNFLYATEESVSDFLISDFWDFFYNECEVLYLASVEALKNSCDNKVESLFSYSSDYKGIKNENIKKSLNDNKINSLLFAHSKGVSFEIESLKRICKGKWFLDYLCEKISYYIINEINLCLIKETQCDMCKLGKCYACYFKYRVRPNKEAVGSNIYAYVEYGDFEFLNIRMLKNFS
ncbi:DUF4435 domain-containing protein [Acinetobacter sp. C26M]|uniref:DUF4435 domain-containing protein n=1 Tax=unclassified Acinetobacter TaxID=196816 RepID=UPI0020369697|nr:MULTISPECIES: DUF4435 domain-containing protein [unclassified Acinetobacter]USA47624.1 DUF4435 domain-containing protein [Acinetobacter sp. C26M]USA51105.1 DUF4435 domain-containing protein [Acinetobacter sp. C26G]